MSKGIGHVGKLDSLHELPLKALFKGQFHVFHVPGYPIRFQAFVPVQEGDPAPVAGGITYGDDIIDCAVGKHADDKRQSTIDVGTKGAGDLYAVNAVDPQFFHHEFASGINGCSGQLDLPDIMLGNSDVFSNTGLFRHRPPAKDSS